MRENDEVQGWHQSTVSWGQLVVSLVVAIGGVASFIFVDRMVIDRRLTVLEERQTFVLKSIAQSQSDAVAFRGELAVKLDSIQQQLNQMLVEFAKHQAGSYAAEEREARNGVRLPKGR